MAKPVPQLRAVSIQIKDVLGAREFALEPGRVTILSGKNASGKSTALQALQAALAGGNLARLARVDASGQETAPEVVLVLEAEDGSEAYRVERRGDKVRVRSRVGQTAAFEDLGQPQGWLKSLYDGAGANPVRFLTAKDDDRAVMLLEALPLNMDRAELGAILGALTEHVPPLPAGLHPLEELAMVREAVFRARTGINRDHKSALAAGDQTRREAPAVIPADPGALALEACESACLALATEIAREEEVAGSKEQAGVAAARSESETRKATITGNFKAEALKIRAVHQEKAAELRAAAERRITELAAEMEAEIDSIRTDAEKLIALSDELMDVTLERVSERRTQARAATEAKKARLSYDRETLAGFRGQRDLAATAQALHDQATRFDEKAASLEGEADRMTAAIDGLDAFRRRMASDLPIDGLEIEGKAIRVRGVPFEQLNTAQKVDIAVRVSSLRAKGARLPVVFVDGAEALDTEHFRALVSRLEAEGLQAFLGRVADHELTVEKIGA